MYQKQREILYNLENLKLSKKQRKSFVIFQDPENPKFGTPKDEISKAKEILLKWIFEKKRHREKSKVPKPMGETCNFYPYHKTLQHILPPYLKP